MNNLEEIDKLLEKYNLPKVNQEQIQSLNRTIRSMEIKTVIKNLPTRKLQGPDSFTGEFYQKFLPSIQSLSRVRLFATPWTAACQASLSFTISHSLLKLMSIESVMPSNHLILCHPLLLLPSIFPSSRVFSNESVLCIRWLKYWSFSFSISHFNEYSGLISFRIDWFDLLTVQETPIVFSNTTFQKYQFFSAQPSLWSNSYILFIVFKHF